MEQIKIKNFAEYCELAHRTINGKLTVPQLRHHAVLGLFSEVGELLGIYQKRYQGHPIDREHVLKELGDILWFLHEIQFSVGSDATVEFDNVKATTFESEECNDIMHSVHLKNMASWAQVFVDAIFDVYCTNNGGIPRIINGETWHKILIDTRYHIIHTIKSINQIAYYYDSNIQEVAEMNIKKLYARYENGFEAEKSINRKEGDI